MLDQIFMQVVDMSKTASVVILMVIIVRMFLKRFPKCISYALWGVVLFRLLCPISFESMISIIPSMTPTSYHYSLEDETLSIEEARGASYQVMKDAFLGTANNQKMETDEMQVETNGKDSMFSWKDMLIFWGKYVWITGVFLLLVYNGICYVKIRNKTAMAIPLKENIYVVDEDISPFVMGIFQPKIYVPNGLSEREQEYIILHERIHMKRLDHVIKLLAFIALCIHWFNPLVWLAFVLSSRDMEMSCDETVIKKMGDEIKADYSESLLAFSTGRHLVQGTPLTFGEGDIKGRIKNMANTRIVKKRTMLFVSISVVILVFCLIANPKLSSADEQNIKEENSLNLTMDIEEHYITKTGDPANLYYIDENNILWGCGRNNAGQLGQGTQDYDFHSEMVKIAENVVHVDYSQRDFVIFLTADNRLYGIGNAGSGALQQYTEFDWDKYISSNYEHYYVSEPVLLMENVIYARCGQDDVACLTEDGAVWIWGTICKNGGYNSDEVYFVEKPLKVLENAVLVTGGWFNHAALLQDGSVWTWGYNFTGNCGVAEKTIVTEPTKVAEDVVMVWTGSVEYNADVDDISDFEGEYSRALENTIIKKSDGSYWICGANVGTEEKVIPYYYEVRDYLMICTPEFHPYELEEIE